jgi:two-component system NarL family sensor kinase
MLKIHFLFLLSVLFFNPLFSQNKIPSKKEVSEMTETATNLMKAGKFEKSLIKSRIALKFATTIKDDNSIATCYNTIAATFDELSEPDKAFFYYQKGLVYAKRTSNDKLKNWLYNNLGNIYCFDKKEYEKGIYYYRKSLEYSTKNHDTTQMILTKLNLAWAYFDIANFNKGLPYLNFINKHHSEFGDKSTIVVLNMLNGMYYSYKNEPEKATSFFETGIKQGNKGDEKSDLSFTHQEYSKFLLKIGAFKAAYQHLAAYNTITKALNDEDKLKKINVAGINLELDEYKREVDIIEIKYKTKQQVLLDKQSKNKQISIIIISSLLLIIILFYFFFQNTKLKQKNKLKDIQSKIQENIINASATGQEIERKKIATFLHDNISALLSSAGLHLSVFSSKNEIESEEIRKTKDILKEAHDKVRDLSHELLPSLLSRFGLFYALNDLCEKNSNSHIHFAYSSGIDEKTRYDSEFEMKMYFIIMELLNNVIKHSKAENTKLSLQEVENELLIHVWDNGVGFDTNEFNTIEGFGLNQIQARINNMKGELVIKSKLNAGTSIYLKVPILHTA